jgi:ppGpp synthetase/RelA/SpoT-type nucleotidyltranferase
MQDIAGCRVIVDSTAAQDKVVDDIRAAFPGSEIYDRRKRPSHGYRAVHVIVKIDGVAVEVQVRTVLQHGWAELSEKLSDVLDPSIKYGGGPVGLRKALDRLSTHVMMEESEEENLRDLRERDTDGHAKNELEEKEQRLRERKLELNRLCKELIIALESAKVDL